MTFDADRVFDYRARRPPLEIVDGRLTELTWPELVIRRTRVDERDLLILVGPEPDYRWRALTADVVELTRRLGVVEWISLGRDPGGRPAYAGGPDHRHRGGAAACSGATSPPGLPGRCAFRQRSSPRSSSRWPRRASRPSATSPRSRTTSRGRTRRPRSRCCRRSATHLGTEIAAGELTEEAIELRTRLDTAAGLDETTRSYVERLEAMYDEQRLPSGDDLISDIERFLRDQGRNMPGGSLPN